MVRGGGREEEGTNSDVRGAGGYLVEQIYHRLKERSVEQNCSASVDGECESEVVMLTLSQPMRVIITCCVICDARCMMQRCGV